MIISSHDQMQSIVKNSRNLEWDGWNVIVYVQDDVGFFDTSGVFKEGKWHIKHNYPLGQNGWEIPDRFLKNANK